MHSVDGMMHDGCRKEIASGPSSNTPFCLECLVSEQEQKLHMQKMLSQFHMEKFMSKYIVPRSGDERC
jgi:hypothetical protein